MMATPNQTRATVIAEERRTLGVVLCFLVAILEGFDLQVAGVAAPRIAPALGLGPNTLGWFFSASTIGLLFGAIAGGRLSDLFGRPPVLAASVAGFGLFSILTGLANDAPMLIAARVLTGVGLGGALPNLLALTAEHARPGRQRRAVAMLYCGVPVGGAAVSLLSSVAGENWRLLFYTGGFLPLLLAPVLLWALPSRVPAAEHGGPEPSGARRTSMLEFLREGRAGTSLLLWIAFFATLVILYLILNWLPTLLVALGLSRGEAAAVQLAFNAGGVLACAATAPLLDRDRPWRLAAAAYLAIIVILYAASTISSSMQAMLIGLGLGAAVLVTQSFLYAQAPTLYPPESRGSGIGAAVAAGRLGSIAGPLVGAALISAGNGSGAVLIGIIPIAIVAGIATIALSLRAERARRHSARDEAGTSDHVPVTASARSER